MKTIMTAVISLSCIMACGCASSKKAQEDARPDILKLEKTEIPIQGKQLGGTDAAMMPMAIIYRTNGNFNDNVPVTLSSNRKEIVAFPAPSDITTESAPVPLVKGYLLDRRGINDNTAFTQYTYESYSALKEAPSLKVLKESIIGGAEVIEIVRLPMTLSEAVYDTVRCNNIILNGLPDCDILLQRHAIQLNPQ